MAQFVIERNSYNLRPCLYLDYDGVYQKGLFHRWIEDEVTEYDYILRSHYQKKRIRALIEVETGHILCVEGGIRFIDSKKLIEQYDYTVCDPNPEDSAKKT